MPFAREDREEFDDSFLHPYIDRSQDDEECEGTWAPRALVELRMYQLSETLREKPEWWRKAEDPEIRKKWFEEAKAQQEDAEDRWRLTDNMINYMLDELEDYAGLRDEATGIECGPYDRIWRSDELIPDELHAALQAAVKPLEAVPDEEKDWHPGSNGQVLDIVHPSLYPLVYGKSLGKQADGTINTFEPPGADDDGTGILERFVSQRFQWLPSDFAVRNDGSVSLASSYINNIAPEHAGVLVPVIEQIMARAVPMWERVLADLRREDMPVRVGPVIKSKGWYGASKGLACVWPSQAGQPYPEEELDDKELEAWYGRQPKTLPDAPPEYDGALGKREKFVLSLKGRTIQVIVKLANIVLTPDNPLYSGGTWHVEGMWNERIVSTFIYYYDSDNVSDSRLAFRQATSEPLYHQQDDTYCMKTLYGLRRDRPCVQDVGSVATKAGRCVAFPNLYQHRVSPFELTQSHRPGVRRILVFFLVDPSCRIPSATEVPPQQEVWLKHTMYTARSSPHSRLAQLPVELVDAQIALTPGIMNNEEALQTRKELMKERTVRLPDGGETDDEDDFDDFNGLDEDDLFSHTFNMCEH